MGNFYDVLIIGGGAAGFFSAINLAEQVPHLRIAILERGGEVLTKVKVSGGGRCNVTHAEFIPKDLSGNYPRGEKELLGPFHSFMTGDTMAWFEERGVPLKIEDDGRVFPISDDSKSIIDCFLREAENFGIDILKNQSVTKIEIENEQFNIHTKKEQYATAKVIIATGSNPKIWKMLQELGHTIISPVASLFTFNIKNPLIEDLPGISVPAEVQVYSKDNKELLFSEGPLLITHWGLSGPAILKLSAWGARELASLNYNFKIQVNWVKGYTHETLLEALTNLKKEYPRQSLYTHSQFNLPKRLWQRILQVSEIDTNVSWAHVTKQMLQRLSVNLTQSVFQVEGKSTFKEEFVTAGGIDLKEVNFKTFESKLIPNLHFAGEVLNIDAITGGFNFQNAWTGGFVIAKSISEKVKS